MTSLERRAFEHAAVLVRRRAVQQRQLLEGTVGGLVFELLESVAVEIDVLAQEP